MIRLGALSALVLLVPGLLMLVMAYMVLRGRRGAAYTLPPARASDGSAYWGAQQARRVETRVTETREPAPRLEKSRDWWDATREAEIQQRMEEAREWIRARKEREAEEARECIRIAKERESARIHPFGWTCVGVSDTFGPYLCAVPPTGPQVHYYSETKCSWEPAPEWLAQRAREVLGGAS
jgi:hypothetical protein